MSPNPCAGEEGNGAREWVGSAEERDTAAGRRRSDTMVDRSSSASSRWSGQTTIATRAKTPQTTAMIDDRWDQYMLDGVLACAHGVRSSAEGLSYRIATPERYIVYCVWSAPPCTKLQGSR